MKTRESTAIQSGEAIKITAQKRKVIKTVYQKYKKASSRVGYSAILKTNTSSDTMPC